MAVDAQSTLPLIAVFGSGGHTTEMLSLLSALPRDTYTPRTYVRADTDVTSEPRARTCGYLQKTERVLAIPRTREVGGSYIGAVWKTLVVFFVCLRILWQSKPALLLVNGPGTCLPMCMAAVFLRLCAWLLPCVRNIPRTKVCFVESVCRVSTLSLTARILYHARLADQIQVQWPQVHERYPRTTYVGILM